MAITPDVFFDLFILSIFFRSKVTDEQVEEIDFGTWTTVDCVARIFFLVGILTKKQRKIFSDDKRLQAIFVRHSKMVYGKVNYEVAEEETDHKLIVKVPNDQTGQFLRKQILMNARIFLTRRGYNAAQVLTKYYPWFSDEAFLKAYHDSRNAFLSKSAGSRATTMENYRANVKADLEIERFFLRPATR